MYWSHDDKMVRIAVFFDGGYFDEVSRFYKYQHQRRSRLSVQGVQAFVRSQVSECEKTDATYCQIVEAHYFRGRFPASVQAEKGKLQDQAAFDDILIRAGIIQHYLPLRTGRNGMPQEMGIDVWLSLEAFDLALHKRFDVLALIGCDADYTPLVRKLSGLGTRTMVLAWDFEYSYTDGNGQSRHKETRTAQALLEACTYPVMMKGLVDDRSKQGGTAINELFVESTPAKHERDNTVGLHESLRPAVRASMAESKI